MDSTTKMWRHQSFFWHSTPLDPQDLALDFNPCCRLIEDIVFIGPLWPCHVWKTSYYKSCHRRQCHLMQMFFWIQNIHRWLVGWTCAQLPTTYVVPRHRHLLPSSAGSHSGRPAVGKRLRWNTAPCGGVQRRRRGCRAFALERGRGGRRERLWPGASKAGAEIDSPTWGHKSFSGLKFCENCLHGKYLGKLWPSTANVWNGEFCLGINDHTATCQYVWRTVDLQIFRKCLAKSWVRHNIVAQGICSSLVERRSTERQKVNLVSPFDLQEVQFREWQETQVQSQAELLSVDGYAPSVMPPHSVLILAERFALSRGKIPLDYAWEGGKTEMERFLLNWPAWAPRAMFSWAFTVGRAGASWS